MPDGSALRIAAEAFARAVAPAERIGVADWVVTNLVVADGPYAGQRVDLDLTPYWREVLDCLPPDYPCNRVAVRKSAQVGYTTLTIGWQGYIAAVAPAPTLVVQPTVDLAKAFNREKLQPTIDTTPAFKAAIRVQKSRDEAGSSTQFKRFHGPGFIALTGANSAAGLRSKTIKNAIEDEKDEWPLDLDGQGSPASMVDARQMAYRAAGDWKRLTGSTPTIEGMSAIDADFAGGDQRFWQVRCPHCRHEQKIEWERLDWRESYPHQARYRCAGADCGTLWEHHEKRGLVAAGRWVAEAPGPGRQPSFHVDALISPFVTWDDIVAKFIESRDDPQKLKAFWNLWLGRSFKVEGEAPEAEKLFSRRADYGDGTLPPGVLFLTAGVDVQQDRLEVEIVGWGIGKTSWQVAYKVIAGDTADRAVFAELARFIDQPWRDAQGNARIVEREAVDANYRPQMVYEYCRGRPRSLPVKGLGTHLAPAIGTPTRQDVRPNGQKRRGSVLLWPVGTWNLKAEIYGHLNLAGPSESGGYPLGWCHFPRDRDLAYYQQLTAERLVEAQRRGYVVKEWHKPPLARNEALDCRVYALAAAYQWGMGQFTPAHWQALAAARGAPPPQAQLDLLQQLASPPPPAKPAAARGIAAGRTIGSGRGVA